MKKIFFLVFFAVVFIGKSQSISNRFNEDDTTIQHNDAPVTKYEENTESTQKAGPGNPNEPVPINNDISFLFITGIAVIVYFKLRNKKVS